MLTENTTTDGRSVETLILEEIQALLLDQNSDTDGLGLDETLMKAGLNSLMLAQLLIQLEDELGVDPFGDERSITDMRTVRDLVQAYQDALTPKAAA
ncbi:acyl carrier protein [Streptomyces chiangmaiensis]|uniref:Acyl carrier protein n=1 Tax=Streptomyces chiangmaiensis TaxID=766497 RepID=A0ABU7FJB6_9ACTN|nr:acyl carrier protein [Streptomyces chiangmaiensis]MED7824220.1 acyl carrier protein [Streptomyces chiangmaiensis]